jgi:flagellar biosynthesis protein FlhB
LAEELRTYPPSARRREELRRRGHAPTGASVTAAAVLVAGVATACCIARPALGALGALARDAFTYRPGVPGGPAMQSIAATSLRASAACAAPIALAGWLAAVLAHNLQTGFLFISPSRRGPRTPPAGSPPWAAGVAAVVGLAAIAGHSIGGLLRVAAGGDAAAALASARTGVCHFVVAGVALVAVLALLTAAWERWRFERAIRMTRREWVLEVRETEGHPVTRARRARARGRLRRR